jgi:VWFA-related protein
VTSRSHQTVAPIVVCLAAGVLLGAQEPSPAPDQPPVFRTGVEAVQVDVTVVDADGNPVTGLTIDDFEIFEDRRPRPITVFAAVDVPSEAIERSYGGVDPDVVTNTLPEGRLYVLALDEVSGANALRTRQFLRDFVERHFGANDLGAVVLVGRGLASTGQDFTHSRSRLLRAIDRFTGGFDILGSGPGLDAEHMRINQLAALRALVEAIGTIPGRRKAILYVSEGVGVDMLDIVDYSGRARTLNELCIIHSFGQSCRPSQDAHAMLVAAHHGNIAFYPINPRGLNSVFQRYTFDALATVTGGVAIANRNDIPRALDRIVREQASYYLLGFDSAYSGRTGRHVGIDVRVNRPGLQVRVRDRRIADTPDVERAGKIRGDHELALSFPLMTEVFRCARVSSS